MKLTLSAFILFSFFSVSSKYTGASPHPPRYQGPSSNYPFHQAVYEGDLGKIYKLIKTVDINQKDNRHGKAPIHWAIQKKVPEIISPFHKKLPARRDNQNSDVYVKIISILIENGADIEIRDEKKGKTALMFAANLGDKNIIKALLKHRADINSQNGYSGQTVLSYAIHRCCNPNGEIISFLIKQGADPHITNRDGKTFLHKTRNEKITLALLQNGVDVHARDNEDKTPLHSVRSKQVASVLMKNGADVNAKDEEGRTPLHTISDYVYGYMYDSWIITKDLIKQGANVNAQDNKGKTALHYAVIKNINFQQVKVLLKSRADINAKDKEGKTPLHHVIKNGRDSKFQIIKILLQHGANTKAKDNNGKIAMDYTENSKIKELLKSQRFLSRLKIKIKKIRDFYLKL